MAEKKEVKQVQVASVEEANLIKSVFAGNEELLKIIRSLFFGLKLKKEEKEAIRGLFKSHSGLLKIFKKKFNPELEKDTPIGQTIEMWSGVDIKGLPVYAITQAVFARKLLIEHTNKALALLEDPDGEQVDLSYDPADNKGDELHIKLVARNSFLSHVETQLSMIKLISDHKELTLDETLKKLQKSSNK